MWLIFAFALYNELIKGDVVKLECESCIYNQNEKEELNCDKIKCCYLKEKENQCLIFDGDDSEW